MSRYLVSVHFQKSMASAFPFGTLAVNLAGCLLIGIFFGLSGRFQWMTEEWRLFLTVGFCGGFTTFSAFAFENLKLLQAGNYPYFILYSAGSCVLGIGLVAAGAYISKG